MEDEIDKIKKQASEAGTLMAKISHFKHPRTTKEMSEMGKKGAASRWGKKEDKDLTK